MEVPHMANSIYGAKYEIFKVSSVFKFSCNTHLPQSNHEGALIRSRNTTNYIGSFQAPNPVYTVKSNVTL